MDESTQRYYYQLGRHQAVLELDDNIPKSCPVDLDPAYMNDWLQGYNEMIDMYYWRRRPMNDQKAG